MVEECKKKKTEQYAINRSNSIQSINQEKSIEQYTIKSKSESKINHPKEKYNQNK